MDFTSFVAVVAGLFAIGGGVAVLVRYVRQRRPHDPEGPVVAAVCVCLVGVVLVGLFVSHSTMNSDSGHTGLQAGSNSSATQSATDTTPTQTALIPTDTSVVPTDTIAVPATATPPQYAAAGSRGENIRLKCNCTDPIIVMLTQIDVEPTQGNMTWTFKLYNNSPQKYDVIFGNIALQQADQADVTFTPTGPLAQTGVSVSSGATISATITFSFIPYRSIAYQLTSKLGLYYAYSWAFDVPFDNETLTF